MDHPENDAQYAGLAVNKGIEQPPIVIRVLLFYLQPLRLYCL